MNIKFKKRLKAQRDMQNLSPEQVAQFDAVRNEYNEELTELRKKYKIKFDEILKGGLNESSSKNAH